MTNQSKDRPDRKKQLLRVVPVALLLVIAALAIRHFYFSKSFLYAGTLEATKVDLSAQISSQIQKVTVQEGARVKMGDELVTLSCEDVRVAQDFAKDNYLRALRLYKSGSGSKEALDQAQSKKDDANVRLGWCRIQSPIQGTVLGRYHEPGEWVSPGAPLLTLANIQDIWAYIYVAQPEIYRLKPGAKIIARLPELKDRTFEGIIVKINSEAEFTPKNVQTRAERTRLVFGVKVSFLGSNQDEILKPGMTIEAELPKED